MEIGRGKSGRRAYALDEIGIVPSRRTRRPEDVSTAWQIDAYRFELPLVTAPMDSVISPATAVAIGRLGGLPVLDAEGLWTRYADPEPLLAEIASLTDEQATTRLQQIYAEPIKDELVGERIAEIRAAGVTIGAHTVDHVLLRGRSKEEQYATIRGSKDALESELGQRVSAFAYPFGGSDDIDDASVLAVEEAGFSTAVTTCPGSVRSGDDPLRLRRRMVMDWSGPRFAAQLSRWGIW